MGWRATAGVALVALVGGVAGTLYWVRAHNGFAPVKNTPVAIDLPEDHGAAAPAGATGDASPKTAEAQPVDPAKAAAPVETGIALRPGEVLSFAANVAKLSTVANLELHVTERRNLLGKSVWHLQAFAHTLNPFRMVFPLDDQFDSYSDTGALASVLYAMHLDERGQKVESIQRMTANGHDTAPPNASLTRVLPGTRDPIGMLQYLRTVDWSKTPEVRCPVYDGHKLYEARAKRTASSVSVEVPAGKFNASTVDLRVFENGVESKDARFTLYLANDEWHTPVLLEAVIPVATARVELTKRN
jgi:hypothetical protein